jgi:hypothetical protein
MKEEEEGRMKRGGQLLEEERATTMADGQLDDQPRIEQEKLVKEDNN